MNPLTFTTLALSLAAVSLASPAAAPSWGPAYGHGGWGGPAAPANIVLSPDGKNVLDTPEVAHAKAAHLAALAQAQSRAGPDHGQDDGSYDPRWDNDAAWQGPAYGPAAAAPAWGHSAPAWNGAPAPVADTPEVAQAKAAHFAAHARAGPAHGAWGPGPAAPAWGPAPAAHIALSPDGQHVLDTPEVAQAKAEHFAAHARVAGHGAPAPVWNGAPSWHSAPAWNQGAPAWNARAAAPAWNAHAAAPVALSHDGHYIQDTPEVAQAKAAHLAAHAQARGHGGPAW